jgi:hypothetical protein
MSHRLRMSAEIGDWLSDLCAADPAAAAEAGAAIVALLDAPDPPGPGLVTDPAASPQLTPANQAAALEAAQQSLQRALRLARAAAAEAAMDVSHAAGEVRQLGQRPQHDPTELAALRRRLAGARLLEQKVTEHSRRSEREVDAFRQRAEAARASYEAAVAARDLHANAAAGQAAGNAGQETQDDARAVRADGVARAALAHVTALLAEAPRLLQRISDGTSAVADGADAPLSPASAKPAEPGPPAVEPGLLELRADPLGGDIRLLFAFEPTDAVSVLAVLEGESAVRVHRNTALDLAGDLLADMRTGQWPPAEPDGPGDVEVEFADSAAFLDRFFADNSDAITQRATARASGDTLSGLRRRRGVSLADLAAATGISEERLWVIEDSGIRVAHVREVVACVRALDGRLDLAADFGDGQAPLLF